MKLLIVESPTKTKTLKRFLGREYALAATGGHVLDLPKSKLGIDIKNDFRPHYVTIEGKKEVLSRLKKLAAKATTVYLAPDPDREGEAIAYHVATQLNKGKQKILRATFNEITKRAVLEGIRKAGKIDMNKVDAQQARRILDRLVGYQISPILWKTVTMGLSAGRVQSVALRLICEREAEIESFVPREFWRIGVTFATGDGHTFDARLIRIAQEQPEIATHKQAQEICQQIAQQRYQVTLIKPGKAKRQAPAPFITSTLQQEAFSRLGFNNKKTMLIAQQLYEGVEVGEEGQVGLITYMRTDSFRVAKEAKEEAASYIARTFGVEYCTKYERKYKARKAAQEAHEAIRPTSVAREPQMVKEYLTRDQYRLYHLIWTRFVASQMADAQYETLTIEVSGGHFVFRAFEQRQVFDGFLRVYDNQDQNTAERKLPVLSQGDLVELVKVDPQQHFTQPPPRFNAGSLVKELEEKGIGRPSTYAQIIATLLARKYVEQTQGRFHPTALGKLVNRILVENFPDIFDVGFTAEMEEELDRIEEGKANWVEVLREFYQPFEKDLRRVNGLAGDIKKLAIEPTDQVCDKCGSPMVIKFGRHGRFLACSAFPRCKGAKPLPEEQPQEERKCPACGAPMTIRHGRFGRFLACSRYPECKNTESLGTGVACPKTGCDGQVVERRSKKGRVFYACSRYPKCRFLSWHRPVPQACPSCGGSYMVEKTTRAKGTYLSCPTCKNEISETSTAEASVTKAT